MCRAQARRAFYAVLTSPPDHQLHVSHENVFFRPSQSHVRTFVLLNGGPSYVSLDVVENV